MRVKVVRPLSAVMLAIIASGCAGPSPGDGVAAERGINHTVDIGVIPRPPLHLGRDVGFSGRLRGRSVWIFGDTFLPKAADDGLQWRSSSWSWTTDIASNDGIGPFEHALDQDGLAIQLLPHTSEESSYNNAHEGHENCAASENCGSRYTPWPGALVVDRSERNGIIYYLNMKTGPGGAWDFVSVSGSVATWSDPNTSADRIEPPLFSDEEPDWGAAAVLVGDDVYVYACESDGDKKPCRVARVPFRSATERDRYRFWAGNEQWSEDWRNSVPVLDGASLFSVHYNAYLEKYLAFYMPGIAGEIALRTAPLPEGPWSEPQSAGKTLPAYEDWNYALIAHPEFSRDGGRVEILSYTRPSGFLEQETRLIELHFD